MADRKVIVLNSAGYQELFQGSDKLVLDGSAEFKSNVHIDGNLSVLGTSVTFDTVTLTVEDINIELGAIKEVHNIAVTPENLAYTLSDGSNSVTTSALGASPTIATLVTAIEAASGYSSLAFTVTANTNSNGIHLTYKTLGAQSESATLTKAGGSPISASAVTNVTDATANGGGFTLYGSTPKTFNWVSSTGSWTSSENIDLASGKDYKINGTSVLSHNTLGSGVTGSSLTSVGTIATGVWNGTAIALAYGGTGHSSYTTGQLLIGKADGTLAKSTLTQGTNALITNSNGNIEIAAKDTTYTVSAEQTGGSDANPDIKITAGGNGSTVNSTVALVGSGATSVTRNSGTQITVSSTDTTHTISATEDSGDVRLSLDNSGGNVTLTGGTATTITRTSASEITITGQDTTYSAATTSAAGLMSATDKTQLDALHAGSNVNYLRANANDDFTGTLAHNNPGGLALYVRGDNSDTTIYRVTSQSASGSTTDTSGMYGFSLIYEGTGTGNNNTLSLYSDNQDAGSQTHVYSVTQDGVLDFKVAPTISSNAVLTSATTFGGDVSGTYNSIVVADNSHDHTIANVTSLASTLAGKYATSGGTLSGKVTISAGSTTEPLLIEGTATDKIGLKGASSPRIVLYEGTTETGHIQWNTAGYIEIKNAEDASSLRIKDTLDFSLDGSTYYNIYHTGADVQISDSHKINFGAGNDLQIYHDGSNSFIQDVGTGGLFIRAANTLGFRDFANSNANWANFNSGGSIDLYHNGIQKFATTSSGVTISGALTATSGVTPGGNITMQDDQKVIFGAGNDLQIYHDASNSWITDEGTGALNIRSVAGSIQLLGTSNNEAMGVFVPDGAVQLYYNNSLKFETTAAGIQVASPSASTGGVEVSRYGVFIRSDDSYSKAFAIHNGGYTASDETILLNSDGSGTFAGDIISTKSAGNIKASSPSHSKFAALYAGDGSNDSAVLWQNGSLRFYNTQERMRIDSSGRLLLNTTTEGHANADDFTIATAGDTGMTLRSGTNGYGNIYFSDATSGAGEYVGYIQYWHGDDGLRFGTASTLGLTLTSTGQLQATGAADVRLTLGSGGTAGTNDSVHIRADGANLLFMNANGGITKFEQNGTERLQIDSSGRVLIGHSSVGSKAAQAPLQVTTSDSGAWALNIRARPSNDYGFIGLTSNDGNEDLVQIGFQRNTTSSGSLLFYTNNGSTYGSERMRIGPNGQIGLSGANYGTSGQVLTSNGSGSAPTWQSASAVTDAGTLDGLDSTQFLRSDAADSFTGSLTGGTGVNITLESNIGASGGIAYASMSGYLGFENQYSDSARGPNKVRLQSDGSWLSGLGISANSTDIYTGGNFNFYKSNSTTSFTHLMKLDSDGRLNVGTTSGATGRVVHAHVTGSGSSYFHATNDGTGSGSSDGVLFGMGSAADAYIWNYESGWIQFATSGGAAMTIASNKYVGIGNSDPSALLNVRDSSANGVIRVGGNTGSVIGCDITYSNSGATSTTIKQNYRASNSNAELKIDTGVFTVCSGSGGLEAMRVHHNRNVGVGLSNPSYEFHVKGAGTVAYFEGTGGNGFIGIEDADDSTVAFIGVDGGSLKFQTSGSSYSDKLVITSAGVAQFAKSVEVSDNILSTRTGATHACYVGQLNSTVTSTILASGAAGFGATNNTSYDGIAQTLLVADESGNAGITIRSGGNSPYGAIHFADGTTGAAQQRAGRIYYQHSVDSMIFATANDEALRINSGGHVGIGTVNPGAALEIYRESIPAIKLNDGGDYQAYMQLAGNDLEIRSSSGQLEFYTGAADGASSTKRLTITSTGNAEFTGTVESTKTDSYVFKVNGGGLYANGSSGNSLYIKDGSSYPVGVWNDSNDKKLVLGGGASSSYSITLNGDTGAATFTNRVTAGSQASDIYGLTAYNSSATKGTVYAENANNNGYVWQGWSTTAQTSYIKTDGSASFGNVSVGTNSAAKHLQFPAATGWGPRIQQGSGSINNFAIFTDNTEYLTVKSNGNVGLYETDPYYRLHMVFNNGNTSLSGGNSGQWGGNGIRIENVNTTVGSMSLAHFRNYDADWHIGSKYVSSNNAHFVFHHEGSEKVRIDNSGNFYIGISDGSLATPLLIGVTGTAASTDNAGSASPAFLRIFDKGANNNRAIGIDIRNRNSGDARIVNIDSATVNTSHMAFLTDTSSSVGLTEKMRINNLGQVLIGTVSGSSYSDRLLTVGDTSKEPILEIRSSNTGWGGLAFSDSTAADASSYRGTVEYNHNLDYLQFRSASNIAQIIDSSGRVLIGGHTSGNYNLEVKGAGQQALLVGSSNAGGASLVLDGDANGDGLGTDYASLTHTTAGNLEITNNKDAGFIFKTGSSGTTRASITSSGKVVIDGAATPGTFAYLNIGQSGTGETRAIDIDGNWSTNESKSISFTHGSNEADLVGQIQCVHQSPGSMIQFGRLYHSGNATSYPLRLYSTSTTTAGLSLDGPFVCHSVQSQSAGTASWFQTGTSIAGAHYVWAAKNSSSNVWHSGLQTDGDLYLGGDLTGDANIGIRGSDGTGFFGGDAEDRITLDPGSGSYDSDPSVAVIAGKTNNGLEGAFKIRRYDNSNNYTDKVIIDYAGNFGIGNTFVPAGSANNTLGAINKGMLIQGSDAAVGIRLQSDNGSGGIMEMFAESGGFSFDTRGSGIIRFKSAGSEFIRIDGSSGYLGVGADSNLFYRITLPEGDGDGSRIGWRSASGNRKASIDCGNTDSLVFRTGATEDRRMTIDASGEVGIGTATPNRLLEILYPSNIGKDTLQPLIRLVAQSATENSGNALSAGVGIEFCSKWNGGGSNAQFGIGRIGARGSSSYDGGLQFDVAQNTGANQFNYVTAMTILKDKNVGIGHSNPVQQAGIGLHIHNASNQARIKLTQSGSGATAGDGFDIIAETNNEVHLLNHEAAALKFGTSDAEKMRLDEYGNLILGASMAANAKFTIRTAAPQLSLYATPGNVSRITMGDTDDHDIGIVGYDNNDNSMFFNVNVGTRMVINSSGTVLIGGTSITDNDHAHIDSSGTLTIRRTSGSNDAIIVREGATMSYVVDADGRNSNFNVGTLSYVAYDNEVTSSDDSAYAALGCHSGQARITAGYSGSGSTDLIFYNAVSGAETGRAQLSHEGYFSAGGWWTDAVHRLNGVNATQNTHICTISGYQASGGSTEDTVRFYSCNASGSPNSSAAGVKLYRNDTTLRSLNAAGTVNASGNDYAEYMVKAGDFTLAKGDICGINAQGKLTNVFADAVAFAVKSTDPSYVGGDNWSASLGEEPGGYSDTRTEEEIAAAKVVYQENLEAVRQTVDRIAFSGQVPVNVTGTTPGQHIIPTANADGSISGIAKSESDLTLTEYMSSVGKVIAIEDDGRAKIIVKVA